MAAKKTGLAAMLANYKKPSSYGSPALQKTPAIPKAITGAASFGGPSPQSSGSPAPVWTPPAQPTGADLPVDPAYDAQVGAYGKSRDDTIAGLEGQRKSGLLGYGYNAEYNADGTVKALAYDPNNPYSQAALARTVYQQSKAGTTNSMAERGLLYGTALTNAQNQNDTSFNVGEDSRQKALTNFLNQVQAGETSAKNDYATNFANAGADRISRAPSNPNYSPAAPTAAPAAAAGPSTADLIAQWKADPITTTYKNAQGHPVRVHANGIKEVQINGVWKKV